MSSTSDEMLAERRLRSSELALETTRRRLVEANEEIGRLHARVVELEQALEAALSPAGDYGLLQRKLEAERARRLVIEQALADERERRGQLERELEISRAPWSEGAEHELMVAQERVRGLEGELEVVRRHAAEFEQAVRVGVDELWGWLSDVRGRLEQALQDQSALHAHVLALESGGATGAARTAALEGPPPGEGAVGQDTGELLALERLEQARSRLRGSLEGAPDAPPSGILQRGQAPQAGRAPEAGQAPDAGRAPEAGPAPDAGPGDREHRGPVGRLLRRGH